MFKWFLISPSCIYFSKIKLIYSKYRSKLIFKGHTYWEFKLGLFWPRDGSIHLISDILGENFDIWKFWYIWFLVLLRLWSAAYARKLTIVMRFNFSCTTEAQREETAQALHPVALLSSLRGFHLTSHHSRSLQLGGRRSGWRVCPLQLRTLPGSLTHHVCVHPMDQNLVTWQQLTNGGHTILASFWAALST